MKARVSSRAASQSIVDVKIGGGSMFWRTVDVDSPSTADGWHIAAIVVWAPSQDQADEIAAKVAKGLRAQS